MEVMASANLNKLLKSLCSSHVTTNSSNVVVCKMLCEKVLGI